MDNGIDYGQADFNARLTAFLDGELSNDEEQQFLTRIQSTPEYLERFRHEKSFHEFLRSKISRRPVSPSLVQSIKAKIQV